MINRYSIYKDIWHQMRSYKPPSIMARSEPFINALSRQYFITVNPLFFNYGQILILRFTTNIM